MGKSFVIMDDSILSHPQPLALNERMERAVYFGLDEKISPPSLWWEEKFYKRGGKTDA